MTDEQEDRKPIHKMSARSGQKPCPAYVPNAAWQPRDNKGRFKKINKKWTTPDHAQSSNNLERIIILDSDDEELNLDNNKGSAAEKDGDDSTSTMLEFREKIEPLFGETVGMMYQKIVEKPYDADNIVYDYVWGLYDDVVDVTLEMNDKKKKNLAKHNNPAGNNSGSNPGR